MIINSVIGRQIVITGNSNEADVLSGKTFYKDNVEVKLTGTMPNSTGNVLPSAAGTTIPTGYHDGTGKTTPDANLVETNLKKNTEVFGITGTYVTPLTGTAHAGDVLEGETFYSDDAEQQIIGTIPVLNGNYEASAASMNPGTSEVILTPPDGYFGGDATVYTDLTAVDADLTAANIKKNIELLGITGTYVTPITGDAVVGEVLSGKKFYKDNAETQLTGTMPNSTGNVLPSAAGTTIPAGYHDGTGKTTPDADLTAANIKKNIELLGITGTYVTPITGDAVVGEVLSGKKFYKDNAETQLTGTMPNSTGNVLPSAAGTTIPAGYHDGTGKTTPDADLTAANIKKNIELLGITGTYVTPITGDAVVGEVLSGKKFYKDNAETQLTGTMPNSTGNVLPSAAGTTIPAGYHDGTGKTTPDADLVASNIKFGVELFGLTGTFKRPLSSIGAITGNMVAGQVLTSGAVLPVGATVTYQWKKADTEGGTYTNISGATNSTYTLTAAENGKYIKVYATGNGSYEGEVISQSRHESYFVASFKTDNISTGSSNNNQVKLPLESGGTYNLVVLWGDGSSNTITAWNQAEVTHTYGSIGTYTVRIQGTCSRFRFNDTGDKLKLLDITAWGTNIRLGNSGDYFRGCSNLIGTYTDMVNLTGTTNMYGAFYGCSEFVGSMANINTSAVTSMGQTFMNCSKFNSSVSAFNTSAVTEFANMFRGCTLFNQSVASFSTTNATLTNGMFGGCSAFNQSVAGFNTANVTNMGSMFGGCSAFNQSVAGFNTAKVTTMNSMFQNCSVFNQTLSNFNTALVTDMANMFDGALVFNQSLSSFDTSKVTNMENMFYNANAFNQSVATFNTILVASMNGMFRFADAFNQSLAGLEIVALTNAGNMLQSTPFAQASYDPTLISWAAQVEKPNVPFHAGTAKYSAGAAATARAALISSGWTITDGGQV